MSPDLETALHCASSATGAPVCLLLESIHFTASSVFIHVTLNTVVSLWEVAVSEKKGAGSAVLPPHIFPLSFQDLFILPRGCVTSDNMKQHQNCLETKLFLTISLLMIVYHENSFYTALKLAWFPVQWVNEEQLFMMKTHITAKQIKKSPDWLIQTNKPNLRSTAL